MSSISGINSLSAMRFGHGNSGRHINMLRGDWEREYRKLVRLKSPKVQGKSLAQFLAEKEAGRGGKDWRK